MISQKELILDFIKAKDFIAKIACLLLAVILWSYIGNQNEIEHTFRVKVDIRDLPDEYVVTDLQKSYISVKIRGNLEDLETVNRKGVKAFLSLKNPIVDQQIRYRLQIETPSDMPENISVKSVDSRIFAKVEKKVSKYVFIDPIITGNVKTGYIVGNIYVNPERVIVYGARGSIEDLESLETQPLSINNASTTVSEELQVNTEGYNFSQLSHERINVKVQIISAEGVQKLTPKLDLYGKIEEYSYLPSDKTIAVYVKGEGGSELKLEENDFKVWIDLSSIGKSDFIKKDGREVTELRVRSRVKVLNKKQGTVVKIVSIVPEKVTVTIKR